MTALTSPVQAIVQSALSIINSNSSIPTQRGDTVTWDIIKQSVDGLTFFIYPPAAEGWTGGEGTKLSFSQMMKNVLTTGVIQVPIQQAWFDKNAGSPFPPVN
jgi:hypothetical protein